MEACWAGRRPTFTLTSPLWLRSHTVSRTVAPSGFHFSSFCPSPPLTSLPISLPFPFYSSTFLSFSVDLHPSHSIHFHLFILSFLLFILCFLSGVLSTSRLSLFFILFSPHLHPAFPFILSFSSYCRPFLSLGQKKNVFLSSYHFLNNSFTPAPTLYTLTISASWFNAQMKACLLNVFWWWKQWWKSGWAVIVQTDRFSRKQWKEEVVKSKLWCVALISSKERAQRLESKKAAIWTKLRPYCCWKPFSLLLNWGQISCEWIYLTLHCHMHSAAPCNIHMFRLRIPRTRWNKGSPQSIYPCWYSLTAFFGNTIKAKRIISGFLQETKLFTNIIHLLCS